MINSISPEEQQASLVIIQVMLQAGQFDEVEALCCTLLHDNPDFGPANYYMAVVAIHRRQTERALDLLRALSRADPPMFDDLELLSRILRSQRASEEPALRGPNTLLF